LYQPRRPRILGVPRSFIERGGFSFQDLASQGPDSKVQPWSLLLSAQDDGSIPAFVDATTAEWMLACKLGGTVELTDERGELIRLRIVGLLSDSIFQSEILIAESNFQKLYPSHEGYNFFLIDAQPNSMNEIKSVLGNALVLQGMEVSATADRMASFLAVENTYLATFQALGGLGLILGALGLAVVLLRTIWERRGELALLRALGFRQTAIGWLVLSENSFLLALGLTVGMTAALLSVVPHRLAGAAEMPWLRVVGLIIVVLTIGIAAGAATLAASLRAPLIPTLRRE
jgi:ABC-type antimicrobial peptide transport system permease subunit